MGYINGFHNVQLYEHYSTHLYNHLNIIISIKDGVEVFILFTILVLFLRHYVSHPHLNDTKLFSLRNGYSKIIDPNEVKNDNKLRFNYH